MREIKTYINNIIALQKYIALRRETSENVFFFLGTISSELHSFFPL